MDLKLVLSCFLVFSSCIFVGYSRELQSLDGVLPQGGGGGGGGGGSMACVTKLLPCKAYLNSSSPPATCCKPIKEVVTNDLECLCNALRDPAIMKSVNVTLDDALHLAKTCGVKADPSMCKAANSPASSPMPSPSTNSSTGGSSSDNTNTTSPASSNSAAAANGISDFGGVGFIAFLLALLALHV